jgi:hypothetical protein
MSVEDEYQEAIAYFQKYPDMWTKLLNGIIAKRNRGFDESAEAGLRPDVVDRKEVIYSIYLQGSAFDEIARDFAGEYPESEELKDPED